MCVYYFSWDNTFPFPYSAPFLPFSLSLSCFNLSPLFSLCFNTWFLLAFIFVYFDAAVCAVAFAIVFVVVAAFPRFFLPLINSQFEMSIDLIKYQI